MSEQDGRPVDRDRGDRDRDDRDRDEWGRPRNARPRDALGRPLRYGVEGVARQAENPARSPEQALEQAQLLLDAGRPFEAHEVLEDAWKAAPAAERELWRGLAQLAVGLTHAARGNQAGALRLIGRGAANLAGYADLSPHGIDVRGLLAWSRAVTDTPADAVPATAGLRPPRLTSLG